MLKKINLTGSNNIGIFYKIYILNYMYIPTEYLMGYEYYENWII